MRYCLTFAAAAGRIQGRNSEGERLKAICLAIQNLPDDRNFETNPDIARSLCTKLSEAQEADERANAREGGALNVYCQELEAQVDKKLTPHPVSVLMTLARTLY
jgi:hypothetical protein